MVFDAEPDTMSLRQLLLQTSPLSDRETSVKGGETASVRRRIEVRIASPSGCPTIPGSTTTEAERLIQGFLPPALITMPAAPKSETAKPTFCFLERLSTRRPNATHDRRQPLPISRLRHLEVRNRDVRVHE